MERIKIDNLNFIINNNNDILKEIIIDNIDIYIMIVGVDNSIVYSCNELNSLFGKNLKNEKLNNIINKKEFKSIRKIILESVFTDTVIKREINFKNKEYKFKFVPITQNDKIEYLLISFYNITKNNKLEGEIELIRKELEDSNSIKSIFLSNISHELKTPLNSIIGFSDILLKNPQNEKQLIRFLKSINSNGKKLHELLSNIIDAAHLESDNFDILYEKFHVSELFEELYDIFDDINYKKNLEFVKLIFIKKENIKIISDFLRLKTVLYNIISNSIKFTEKGNITISFEYNEDYIIFKISDTGIGIEEENIKYIFERFWQDDSSSKKSYRGAGLGLYISKKIIDILNGEIYLESKLNKGTTFYVKLPLEKIQEDSELVSAKDKIDFSGKKVLVIDELPINYKLLGMYLKSLNIEAISSNNINNSINIYETNKDYIDIIFLDLDLTNKEIGFLVKRLKEINKDCVIIAKSKRYDNYADYMLKSLVKSDLITILNEVWQK